MNRIAKLVGLAGARGKGKRMKEENDRAGAGRLGGNSARECQSGSDLARAQERK